MAGPGPSQRDYTADHAYERKRVSASTNSRADYEFGPLIVGTGMPLNTFYQDGDYSLDELASHLKPGFNLQAWSDTLPKKTAKGNDGQQKLPSQRNEMLAKLCVEECELSLSLKLDINKKMPILDTLPPMCCSPIEKPDVLGYDKNDNLLLIIEVYSSPFENTLRKTIIGAVDMLRLLRNTDDTFSTFTAFAFPKIGVRTSVVAVTVTFESLKFRYSLRSVAMQEVKSEIEGALSRNDVAMPKEIDQKFLVKLSSTDLAMFPDGSQQLPSRFSILVECCNDNSTCYKFFSTYRPFLPTLRLLTFQASKDMKYCVHYKWDLTRDGVEYNRMPHNPLSREEAASCLYDLLPKIKTSLDELHECGFAHNDVRLPNICFSDDFDPVLIDLDNSSSNTMEPAIRAADSCMYQRPSGAAVWTGETSDLVQLGWLAAYVCDSNQDDYHAMTFKKLSQECQSDVFLSKLLDTAVYSSQDLSSSIIFSKMNAKTLQDVINARS